MQDSSVCLILIFQRVSNMIRTRVCIGPGCPFSPPVSDHVILPRDLSKHYINQAWLIILAFRTSPMTCQGAIRTETIL